MSQDKIYPVSPKRVTVNMKFVQARAFGDDRFWGVRTVFYNGRYLGDVARKPAEEYNYRDDGEAKYHPRTYYDESVQNFPPTDSMEEAVQTLLNMVQQRELSAKRS